jgi:hypothetical protein
LLIVPKDKICFAIIDRGKIQLLGELEKYVREGVRKQIAMGKAKWRLFGQL